MLSLHKKIAAFRALQDETEALQREISKKAAELLQLQKKCDHKLIIHYGDLKFSEMYPDQYALGEFYCPACGATNLMMERSAEGQSFVLEASGFLNNIPELNLKAVLTICAKEMLKEPENASFRTPEGLVNFLGVEHGIRHYRVKVHTRD